MPRRFTLPQAEALLPKVGRLIREAVALKSEYHEAQSEVQAFGHRISVEGGVMVDRQKALALRRRVDAAGERLKSNLEAIQETGCVVKDLDIGLVDFPTNYHGREVYLCWKMDEPGISFWHATHEGFAGRKPIDAEFLANHEGDREN